jgi:3-phenylpropionate/trans-cinnamate dioxygenase ferredoxin reductase subunit
MDPTTTRVVAVREVGPDAIALDVETPPEFSARPGQFVKFSAEIDGERESRFYTISSPHVEESFEVTIEVDPEGTLGPWLADLEPGDELELTGPFGTDYYEDEPRAVVLAGGPGIGPAIGIAERAIEEGNAAAVVYRDSAPCHEDRLDALREAGVPVFVLDDDADLTDATAEALEGGGQVFIYGFADFLDVATDAVEAAGGDTEGAKVENFG